MNLASLSTLDANDPLPLALGPRHEPPVPVAGAAASPVVRVVGDKLVSSDPETGRLSCRPVERGAFKTHTDFPNRNPYFKRPPPEVEIALNAMETELNVARDKLQDVRTGRLETPAWQAWPPEPPAQGAKPKIQGREACWWVMDELEAEQPLSGAKLRAYYAEKQSARGEQLLTEKAVMQVAKEMQAARMAAKHAPYYVCAGGRARLEDVQDGLAKPALGCRFGAVRADGYVEIERAD